MVTISCKRSTENPLFRVTFDANGNKESEVTYINDTVKHGVAKYYYKGGMILKDELSYINNVKDGWHSHFSIDGNIESRIFFKDGKQEGKTYWYYSNGKLEQVSNWHIGKAFGDAVFFTQEGKLESYSLCDFEEHVRYLIKYDSLGKIIKEEGKLVSQFLLDGQFDSIPVNKEVNAKICVALPPNRKIKVTLKEYGPNGDLISIKEPKVKSNAVEFKRVYTSTGDYKIVTKAEMRGIKGLFIRDDSIITFLKVVK